MEKNSRGFFVTILAISACLFMAGCTPAFNDPSQIQKEGSGTVRIIINGEESGAARTVVPGTPQFTYNLIFTKGETQLIKENVPSDTLVELENGDWVLRAEGKKDGVTLAESDLVQFTIGTRETDPKALQLVLHPLTGLPNGSFRYDIQFDKALVIGEASMVLSPLSDGTDSGSIDVSAGGSGTLSLAPGYYRLTINVRQERQSAVKGEIVHIYSDTESEKSYAFTAKDFADEVVLGGKIEYPGYTLQDIVAYEHAGYDAVGWAYIDGDNWDITIPASHERVYLIVELLRDDGTLCHSKPELYPADGSSISAEGDTNITLAIEKFKLSKNIVGNGDIEIVSESFQGEWIDIQVKPGSARLSSLSYRGMDDGAEPEFIHWPYETGFTMPLTDVRIDAVFK
jgi:hypothetical protein